MYPQGFLREHSNILIWVMRALDTLVLLVSCQIAYYPVFGDRPFPLHYQVAVLVSVLLTMVVFQAFSLYRAWRGIDYAQEFTSLLLAWSTTFAILAFATVVTKTSADYSRAWFLTWYVLGGSTLLLGRYLLRRALQHLRRSGFNLRHIMLIGSGQVGRRVAERILEHPEAGFNICAYLTDDPDPPELPPQTRTGTIAEVPEVLATRDINQIWLAMPLREADQIEEILNELKYTTADIRLVPDIFSFRLINHSVSTVAGLPVLNLSVTPMDGVNRWIKALEDLVIAATALLLTSPLLLLIALLVKISSPGPVLYKQPRLSWNGREFNMYKFRTMPVDTESSSGPVWATAGEKRATPIGAILRRTSLDELPQFWNVLRGDMSVVGPRPERAVFVNKFKGQIPSYMQKHLVKGGITGWAQVHGWRGDTDLQKRIEHDLYYIDNWSVWLDLKIIIMTIFKRSTHRNAH